MAVHRGNHRYRTLVYRSEGLGAGTVGFDDPFVTGKFLHLDDVHPGAETVTLGGQNNGPDLKVLPVAAQ